MSLLIKLKSAGVINITYVILRLVKMPAASAYPFANIIIPRLIIDELPAGRDINRLTILATSIVGINLVYKAFTSVIDALIQKQASIIDLQYEYFISDISMGLPYELLEKDAVIQLIKQAREGKNRSGGLTSLIDSFFLIVTNIVTTLGLVVLIASLDFWLILLAAITIIINTWVQSNLKKFHIEFFNVLMKHNTKFMYLSSVILNRRYAKDIRLYEANRTFTTKMDEFAMDLDAWFKKTGRKQIKHSMLSHLTDSVSQAVIYGYLAFQFLGGLITIGLFTMYATAVTAFTNTIVDAMKNVPDIQEKHKWLKPSFDFMEYRSAINKNPGSNETQMPESPSIEFRNVSYRYENSKIYALKNVTMLIPYGQKLSVIGMNGAGKTTLIKLLMRLYAPTEGEILINGKNMNDYPIDEYYKFFSAVFQDFKLFAGSVKENVVCMESANMRDDKLKTSLIKTGVYERIEKMPHKHDTQIYKLFDMGGVDLSGGEEQRLALSRALYKNAPIVILDEPTSALDPKTEYEIYTSMDNLVKNKTSIYISHRMTSCMFCDVVAVFDEGELVQYGNHKELIKQNDIYAGLFNTQAQYYL